MITTELHGASIEEKHAKDFGEAWIQAIAAGQLDRLAEHCDPNVRGLLLLPRGPVSLTKATDLVAEYRDWFGSYNRIEVEASRVAQVGERLGVFYRLLLHDGRYSERIEQQLYFWMKDGRVRELHLLCSGFQPAETQSEAVLAEPASAEAGDPKPDDTLELLSDAPDTASTCAILTPMIRSKLRGLHSGQVLEVRVNDPQARGDVEAWSRLSGNPLLKVVEEGGQMLRFYLKKK